ncbi:sugar phosphate isomerase/epimerase family protein [Pseudochelatococcus contaminans]|uniref:Sugar phosphate isomerase/epimerase n=1 Tax=Pseudochelatococcus contaminans TaxID=1538103 RepID=A0A7W5Z4B8_9HYPH|nr:TIM barrel protein [Pseudochelatococcus contaminans]MBB3809933.1 sugar phosphate isomerase/epimerase [Pseudochelatococcus contaminans]
MAIVKNNDRQFKLGMHSYSLHLSGCGESWGFDGNYAFEKTINLNKMMELAAEWGLDVLHITLVDLDNDVSPEHLSQVKANAKKHGLDLELNVSFDAPSDPRVNATVEEALNIAHAIGAQLVKFSLDIKRTAPLYGSSLRSDIVVQLAERIREFKENLPLIEKYGIKIALENHCDLFADEVIWIVEQLHHPLIGACLDTMNSLVVGEGVEECVRKLSPYAYCVHFCDIKIVVDPNGTHSIGTAVGQGDNDCVKIMQELRANAPEALDTIVFEVELPLSGYSIEEGREIELQAARESIAYMRDKLNVGRRHRHA